VRLAFIVGFISGDWSSYKTFYIFFSIGSGGDSAAGLFAALKRILPS
jgi:hypothetical protein